MSTFNRTDIPIGTKALIFSKLYYGVLNKRMEDLEIERYYSILYFLKYHKRCSQQFICDNLAVDKTAMVKVVNYLLKSGLVRRLVNPRDRREYFIILTRKGLTMTDEIVKNFKAIDKLLFSGLSKVQQQVFSTVLGKLSQDLREMPSNDLFFNYRRTSGKKSSKR